MPQLTIYLDEATAARVRAAAKASGLPVSRWVRQRLGDARAAPAAETDAQGYPLGFWENFQPIDDPTFVAPPDIDIALDGPMPVFE